MAGISSKAAGSLVNKKLFNAGCELQNEEFSDCSGLEIYETPFRGYDPQAGRFWHVDPLADKFPHQSPYTAMDDDPINKADPTGMAAVEVAPPDDYIFNEKGDYVRTDKTNLPDKLVVENSTTKARQNYEFSDLVTDPQQIEDGIINKLVFVSQTIIKDILISKGAFNYDDKDSWSSFYKKSKGGKAFDFSYSVIPTAFAAEGVSSNPLITPSPMLFLPEGDYIVQNHMNFGNFLWAASGFTLGFSYSTLQIGGHVNSIMNPGSNGYSRQLDSKDDQNSIKKGAYYADRNLFRTILELRHAAEISK
jgi:RHS repeat-associated protein